MIKRRPFYPFCFFSSRKDVLFILFSRKDVLFIFFVFLLFLFSTKLNINSKKYKKNILFE
ncbi:hypothetical protein BpHYR1_020204, partial [Brachionus plicatilis]